MKNTGIVRPIDPLGRVTLPIELRRTLDINEGDKLEIFTDKGSIVLTPEKAEKCFICGSTENLIKVDGTSICRTHAIAIRDKITSL